MRQAGCSRARCDPNACCPVRTMSPAQTGRRDTPRRAVRPPSGWGDALRRWDRNCTVARTQARSRYVAPTHWFHPGAPSRPVCAHCRAPRCRSTRRPSAHPAGWVRASRCVRGRWPGCTRIRAQTGASGCAQNQAATRRVAARRGVRSYFLIVIIRCLTCQATKPAFSRLRSCVISRVLERVLTRFGSACQARIHSRLREPFVLDGDGCVQVPHGTGLGVELDDSALAQIMQRPWSNQRG